MQYFRKFLPIDRETLCPALACAAALLLAWPNALGQGFGGGFGGNTTTDGSRQYFNNTMLGDALIEIDPETRSLIIITDEETNVHIDQVIKQLDRPKPQVLIKVVFVEVTHRNDLDIGIEGSLGYTQETRDGEFQSNYGSLLSATLRSQGGFKLLDSDFSVTARALAEAGNVEVLSRPSILARNNQEAVITVGQEVPFIRDSRITDQGDQINTVEYEDIGIILRVTPFITSDGLVEMIVAPEISTITDETIQISAGVEAPVFAKRSADTVVVTGNGQTVVIGGLMERNKRETVRKVPLLGDIPLLGWAFRRKIKEDTKTELLIFLTPYVVNQPEELEQLTREETDQTEFNPIPDEPLEKYIDNADKVIDPARRAKRAK